MVHVKRITSVKLDLKRHWYILTNGTITIKEGPSDANEANKKTNGRKKEAIFKNCVSLLNVEVK